jgi:hypothetical protein
MTSELLFQPQPLPHAADLKSIEGGQHGHLVAQIVETQKELEDKGHFQSQDSQPRKVEIVSTSAQLSEISILRYISVILQ